MAKEKANFLAEEGKDTTQQAPEERGEKRQQEEKRKIDLMSKVVLWDILADVIRISEEATKNREIEES